MDRPKLKDTMRTQPGIIELISPAVLSASPPLPPELPEPWIPIALPQPIITNKAMPTNSAKQEARQTLLGSFIWVFAIASHGRCDGWDGCDGVTWGCLSLCQLTDATSKSYETWDSWDLVDWFTMVLAMDPLSNIMSPVNSYKKKDIENG